jgi:hypothetical protein
VKINPDKYPGERIFPFHNNLLLQANLFVHHLHIGLFEFVWADRTANFIRPFQLGTRIGPSRMNRPG